VSLGGLEKLNENFGCSNMVCVMVGDLAVLHAIRQTDGGLEPLACLV
jgi:hypothetical protein